jgi:hypothetical protein
MTTQYLGKPGLNHRDFIDTETRDFLQAPVIRCHFKRFQAIDMQRVYDSVR